MSRAIAGLIVCSLTTLMGCIITKDPGYTVAVNRPPVVLSHPDSPMERFRTITINGGDTDPDAGVSSTIEFEATVYDPDEDQDMQGVILLDWDPDSPENRPFTNEFRIPPNGTVRREARFRVNRQEFEGRRGCHVLELHVSERFVNVALNPIPASTETPPDLGRGIWFLNVEENAGDDLFDELGACR